ncbi:MAG TPA: radical SAM protein [Deltaproteobacteria bacterium]|nr:radical SAM protein [Deltaproteobacteria bacterium]
MPHHGEEPPLSGTRGAGTIFFSSCNLRCSYCQNYQISHSVRGRPASPDELADMMLHLQKLGCHNIEFVTGTSHVAGIVRGVGRALDRGLSLPLVYNCGGYESAEVIECLHGIIDVYLPDFKYADTAVMRRLGAPPDYAERALASLKIMVRQVGEGLSLRNGVATAGIIVRHLVLPGMVDNSLAVVRLLARHVSKSIPLSLMAQYTPIPAVADDTLLGRRVAKDEYECVVDEARDLGFEYLFVQQVDAVDRVPDFGKEAPFQWD